MSAFLATWLPVALFVLAALIGVAVAIARSHRRPAAATDSSVVAATLTAAAFWAGLSVIGAALSVAANLQPQVKITVPVQEFWPQLPAGTLLEGMPATISAGGFTSATLLLEDLSVWPQVGWTISQALGWLIPGTVAGLIAIACFQLRRGSPFAPVLARVTFVTALVVLIGGTAAQVLGDLAGSAAAVEALQWRSGRYDEIAGIENGIDAWWPKPGLDITIPFWPLGAGLGLAALAAIFRYGSGLQRDTEGLV